MCVCVCSYVTCYSNYHMVHRPSWTMLTLLTQWVIDQEQEWDDRYGDGSLLYQWYHTCNVHLEAIFDLHLYILMWKSGCQSSKPSSYLHHRATPGLASVSGELRSTGPSLSAEVQLKSRRPAVWAVRESSLQWIWLCQELLRMPSWCHRLLLFEIRLNHGAKLIRASPVSFRIFAPIHGETGHSKSFRGTQMFHAHAPITLKLWQLWFRIRPLTTLSHNLYYVYIVIHID